MNDIKRYKTIGMIKKCFFLILLTIIAVNAFSQTHINITKPKISRCSEAYGYLLGKEYTVEFIKNNFPHLRFNVIRIDNEFNSNFGKAKEGIKKYLSEEFGQNITKEFDEGVLSELVKAIDAGYYTEEFAISVLTELESHAKGNIPSPILETLLSFQFSENPVNEFFRGFTYTFRTKGHYKAKNTDWQIKVPKSWKAQEADRPNIIQKFNSEYGSGTQSIMLMVTDLPLVDGISLSSKEIEEIFSESEIKYFLPPGGEFISFTKMVFDTNVGGMVEYELVGQSIDIAYKLRSAKFAFIRANKLYTVEGLVASEPDSDLSLEMKKYLPLFKQVANSIVVHDQYK